MPGRTAKRLLVIHAGAQPGKLMVEERVIDQRSDILRQGDRAGIGKAGEVAIRPRPLRRLCDQSRTDRIPEPRAEMGVLLDRKTLEPTLHTCPWPW